MKISDATYFDYIDGLLNEKERLEFEQYLNDNQDAQKKLSEFKNLDNSIDQNFNTSQIDDSISKFGQKFDDLQSKIDTSVNTKEKNQNFISKIFEPILVIPIQSKAVLFAVAVGIFFIGNQQIIETGKMMSNDQYLQVSEVLVDEYPNLFKEGNTAQSVELKLESNNYSAVSVPLTQTRSSDSNKELECPQELDRKQIKISNKTENTSDNYYIYCGSTDSNKWDLHHIEIQIGSEPIDITGDYKIISDYNFIYLFPKN